jgi:cytochrome c oxidase assembly factor CtaG
VSVLILGLYMAAVVAWRTPAAVDAIEAWPWLLALEAVSLVAIGVAFWLELVEFDPLAARNRPLRRALLAATAMWTVWTISYLAGFSSTLWYTGFDHVAGRSLSVAADQQFSTGVLWVVAAVSFMPVLFWNLLAWLRSEEELGMGLPQSVAGQRPPG